MVNLKNVKSKLEYLIIVLIACQRAKHQQENHFVLTYSLYNHPCAFRNKCQEFFLSILFFRDFLPRGSGIVTRRPLILQLINGPTGD